ncbi:Hypothetical protein R9X50_00356600 [Acrodontium crateriforme]|uniref:L-asparaginase II n=1 Tax=Acrodontium crateriforme TaxID=150365 RepID=A0AAQ3R9I4_9PEZI|nr:Hypothetical protein R9X50_00356600 [Acrodontium crateriforme]
MVNPQSSEGHVAITRGGINESTHQVSVAVVDTKGELLYFVGDASRVTLMRSAAKPAQALAILETGCFEKFALDEADLALMCASHSSEERHVQRARAILDKINASEGDFRCGGHASLSARVNRQWAIQGIKPGAVHNNCSGKHGGMLAGALALNAGTDGHEQPSHPMQRSVRRVVAELAGLDDDKVQWALDGCNLPTPALPLCNAAGIYALFATAGSISEDMSCSEQEQTRTRNMARIFRAMSTYPELVGGQDRFCTDLMTAYKGELIGKVGAAGFYGIGIKASEQTRALGAKGGMGIAIKIADGNQDVLYAVAAEVLTRLEIGTGEMRSSLEKWRVPLQLNTADVVVGRLDHVYTLHDAQPVLDEIG